MKTVKIRHVRSEEADFCSISMPRTILELNNRVHDSRDHEDKGSIGNQPVVVLIDYGNTHNFIAQRLVDDLKLPITVTKNYGVILGSGRAVKGKGICKAVAIKVADITIVENFLPLELGNIYVILGMQWLYTLGITEVDW